MNCAKRRDVIKPSIVGLAIASTLILCCVATDCSLADGRMWEQVSPQNKEGAVVEPIFDGAIQAAVSGDAFTYITTAPLDDAEGYNGPERSQFLSTRSTSDGWTTRDIATPHDSATELVVGEGSEYRLFTPELTGALVEPNGDTLLGGATEYTPYLRSRLREESGACTCYKPLLTFQNVEPSGTKFGEPHHGASFVGAAEDLSHIILSSEKSLTNNAAEQEPDENLYEWNAAAGNLELVSVLPDGKAATSAPESAILGDGATRVMHAVSSTGSRVIWTSTFNYVLYLRDTAREETLAVSETRGGSGGGGYPRPTFQWADPSGSRILFTDDQQLTHDSSATFSDFELYAFELEEAGGKLIPHLTDLTPPKTAGEHVAVQGGILGASEDGTYVYFVAQGVLSNGENNQHEKPTGGADNVYLRHYNTNTGMWEQPMFIASLSSEDEPDWQGRDYGARNTARVSPDGQYLAFMSDRQLTSYENTDANSHMPDEEVYLYDATQNDLTCASCNPSGAQPEGYYEAPGANPLVDKPADWGGQWLSANIPDWVAGGPLALYQPRYLADSGRLFFNASDGLVPQDTNHTWDVYEYEPAGAAHCTTQSESFAAQDGGCVALLSAGLASAESAFLDANEDGSDVFFLTPAKLVPEDIDSALDVYDAHECTTAAPCVTQPVSAEPCGSAVACRGTVQDLTFGAPTSASFTGAGNIVSSTASPLAAKTKAKAQALARKRAKALRACRRRHDKRKRLACEARTRKRFKALRRRAGKAADVGMRGHR